MVPTFVTACSALPCGRVWRLRVGTAGTAAPVFKDGTHLLIGACFG